MASVSLIVFIWWALSKSKIWQKWDSFLPQDALVNVLQNLGKEKEKELMCSVCPFVWSKYSTLVNFKQLLWLHCPQSWGEMYMISFFFFFAGVGGDVLFRSFQHISAPFSPIFLKQHFCAHWIFQNLLLHGNSLGLPPSSPLSLCEESGTWLIYKQVLRQVVTIIETHWQRTCIGKWANCKEHWVLETSKYTFLCHSQLLCWRWLPDPGRG